MKTANIIITVAVLAVAGFLGYKLYQLAQQFGGLLNLPGGPVDWASNAATGQLTQNQITLLGQQAAAGVTAAGGTPDAAAAAATETANFATWSKPLVVSSVLGIPISTVSADTLLYGVSIYDLRKGGQDDSFILGLYKQQQQDQALATAEGTAVTA